MSWLDRAMGRTTPSRTVDGSASPAATAKADLFTVEAVRHHPGVPVDEATSRLRRQAAYLTADGDDLEMRIVVESRVLAALEPDDLADRFEHTQLPRVDAYPEDHDLRLAWLADVLRAEHQDVVQGRISIRNALAIAAAPRGVVPEHLADVEPRFGEGPSRISDKEIAEQAGQIERMSDRLLLHRFREVPGSDDGIPAEHRRDARLAWLESALRAEETRRLCGLSPGGPEQAPVLPGLEVDLLDIEMQAEGDLIAYWGALHVQGGRVCAISSPGDGTYLGTAWAPGCDERDLAELDDYVGIVGTPRIGGDGLERPETLADVMLDQVMTHIAVLTYRGAAATAVLFCPEPDAHLIDVLSVPVPDGGSREGAIAHIREAYPEAMVLDDMPETDAALLLMALS